MTRTLQKHGASQASQWTRAVGCVLALLSGVLLAGCLDLEQDVTFNTDGSASMVARLQVDKEMEDVYAALEAIAKLSPDPALAPVRAGLCSTASLDAAKPAGRTDVPAQARRYVSGSRSICEIRTAIRDLTGKDDPSGLGIVSLSKSGQRQWEVTLDFSRLPDITPLLMVGLVGELQKRPEFQSGVPGPELQDVTEKVKKALRALTTVAMRDRYVQVTFLAPQIVSAEGAVKSDARSAQFRLTFAELAEIVLRPEMRATKRYRIVVAY